MKKISLLVGSLGGALAGYILSNDGLRKELMKAKDAESAAKMLGKHLSKDGKRIAKEVQQLVKSPEVQTNVKKAKSYVSEKFTEVQGSLKEFLAEGQKTATQLWAESGLSTTKKKSVKKKK
jgi:uncharacterized membrane protein YheB (UPF0754 family)